MAGNRYGRDDDWRSRDDRDYAQGHFGDRDDERGRGYGARGPIDDRFDYVPRTRQEAFDTEGRSDMRGIDARTGDQMGQGDKFEPGARSGQGPVARGHDEFRGASGRAEDRYDQRGRSSRSGLTIFDHSVQITHIWLNEIVDEIGPDKQIAWHALTAVLRTIRDRIQPELAVHLGAQLPLLIRGAYYDQFRLTWPERTRNLDEFLDSVADHMRGIGRPVNPRHAFHAVARTLTRHVSEGQIRKVVDSLPQQVAWSWMDSCRDMRGPEARAGDWSR